MSEKDLIESLWHFFESVKDTSNKTTAKICADLIINYEFDIKELPETLKENVENILNQHYKESHFNGIDAGIYNRN